MSEGTFFHCSTPNLTLYIGSYIIKFYDGLYPKKGVPTTDEGIISAIKGHDLYGKTIESEEDRQKRLTPDPKVIEDLQAKALERLQNIPGVVPSGLTPSKPLEEPQDPSPEPKSDLQVPELSLTEVSRANRSKLLGWCDTMEIEVTESDTVGILRRKVRAWIRENVT
jgi:hypothetical protein